MTITDFSTPALRAELDRRGYTSRPKRDFPWEKPCNLSRRLGYSKDWLSVMMKRRRITIPDEDRDNSVDGRLIRLRSNPNLEDFARKPEPKNDHTKTKRGRIA